MDMKTMTMEEMQEVNGGSGEWYVAAGIASGIAAGGIWGAIMIAASIAGYLAENDISIPTSDKVYGGYGNGANGNCPKA